MKRLFLLNTFLFCFHVFGWNDMGHAIVAQIAYNSLSPDVKAKADALISSLDSFYPADNTFVKAATWADHIRSDWKAFERWHYVDQPFATNRTLRADRLSNENIVWALCQSTFALQHEDKLARAMMLRFLLHFVGDIHQPLHAITRLEPLRPHGDHGGNDFHIMVDGKPMNLHIYWDIGLGQFEAVGMDKVPSMAAQYTKEFPREKMASKASNMTYSTWAKESYLLSKKNVYKLPEGSSPDKAYRENGQRLVREQIALAGYRLAHLLERLIGTSNETLLTGCPAKS